MKTLMITITSILLGACAVPVESGVDCEAWHEAVGYWCSLANDETYLPPEVRYEAISHCDSLWSMEAAQECTL